MTFPVIQWDPISQPSLEHDPNTVFVNGCSWESKSNYPFYIVYAGRQIGIYKSWFATSQRVHQHSRARYAGAANLRWAQTLLALAAPMRMIALCPPPASVLEQLETLADELKNLDLVPEV